MKSAKSGEKAVFTSQPLENMSPAVRAKAQAWIDAREAERAAKRAFEDIASAAARKAKVITTGQYLVYGIGFGQTPSYTVKEVEAKAASNRTKATGPSF